MIHWMVKTNGKNHNNRNELLLILHPHRSLLVCGTGNAGKCEIRNITKIQQVTSTSSFYLVTSTVDFNQGLVTEVPSQDGMGNISVVFIATTFSLNPRTQKDQFGLDSYYPISARETTNLNKLVAGYYIQMEGDTSRPNFPVRVNYHMSYRAIMELDNFMYLISNQNHTTAKIAKMCLNTPDAFEEIPITCNHNSSSFPFIQHAKFVTLESGQKVLFGLFSDFEDNKNPSAKGAVCLYTEDEILESFKLSRIDRYNCPPRKVDPVTLVYSKARGPQEGCSDPNSLVTTVSKVSYLHTVLTLSNLYVQGDKVQMNWKFVAFK